MQHRALLPQRLAGIEHRAHQREQARPFAEQLDYPRLETGDADGADLEAEGLECSADFVVDCDALFQQRPAVAQQQAELLALRGLDVDGSEPSDPHRLGDRARVVAISLDRHGSGRALHPPRLDADRRQPGRSQLRSNQGDKGPASSPSRVTARPLAVSHD